MRNADEEIGDYITNALLSVESVEELDADDVFSTYLSDCKDIEEEPDFTIEDLKEVIEELKEESKNTCGGCSGIGCNYCYALNY